MKNTFRDISMHICPILIAVLVCAVLLLQLYAESLCTAYARSTYNYLPLYGMRIVFCLVWAVGARIFIALRRKKDYGGRRAVNVSAVISVLLLLAIAVIDRQFLTAKLMLNQAYDVLLLLSAMCCVMRKKSD